MVRECCTETVEQKLFPIPTKNVSQVDRSAGCANSALRGSVADSRLAMLPREWRLSRKLHRKRGHSSELCDRLAKNKRRPVAGTIQSKSLSIFIIFLNLTFCPLRRFRTET